MSNKEREYATQYLYNKNAFFYIKFNLFFVIYFTIFYKMKNNF